MSFSIKLVQNSVRNVLLLQIGVKTLCATVVLLEIGFACVKNVKKTTTRRNILTILGKAYEAQLT